MPKRVFIDNNSQQEQPTEFAFFNSNDEVEYVELIQHSRTFIVHDCDGNYACFYNADIDKLIKALQTAKEYL